MTIQELWDSGIFKQVNEGEDMEREITKPFCCDLLSIAMSKAEASMALFVQLREKALSAYSEISRISL